MKKLNSIIASVPLFFNSDESVDFKSLSRYLNLVGKEAHTQLFYLMAYNSRISLLDYEEIIKVNEIVRDCAAKYDIMYSLCPPYKATNATVDKFLNNFLPDESLFGVSMLFPERVYADKSVLVDYFSIPNQHNMKTLFHEMKYVSGFDGSLTNWDIETIQLIETNCDISAIKEDSKTDSLTSECLENLECDIILAGGGLTQTARFKSLKPKSWLAGVSLIRPDLARCEHLSFVNLDEPAISFFINEIEAPFFAMSGSHGWHCVHKALLHHVHGFPPYERKPMPYLQGDNLNMVIDSWDSIINPAIDKFIKDFDLKN